MIGADDPARRPRVERAGDASRETRVVYRDGGPPTVYQRTARLVRLSDPARQWSIERAATTLGAGDHNDVALADDAVSSSHCRIVEEPDGYAVHDLGSKNGTFVDGVRIREAYLRSGCTIAVGHTELRFLEVGAEIEIAARPGDRLRGLIGASARMRELYAIIEQIAPTAATVLVEGETGAGKEVVARTIHELSDRASGPFMVLDCGAVQPQLLEAELFGHERGSFTGAITARKGIFELAHGGTLFLDEIGELPLELQPKLLRVIDRKEVRRVGASMSFRVDARVVAATHRNLEDEVRERRFREDLFYRIGVIRLGVPPLRDRAEDIPLLIDHLLRREATTDGARQAPPAVSVDALSALCAHPWPGNVRQLANALAHAVSMCSGHTIRLGHLPAELRPAAGTTAPDDFKAAKDRLVSSFERAFVASLITKHDGNISRAARDASIHRNYFRQLARKYRLKYLK
jgi:DNA-binding NtrC family response regulator